MDYTRVGSRGFLFTFNDPYRVNVYAIDASEHLFICDTYLGTEPMQEVVKTLRGEGIDKPIIVFLSHADYDHIWGNGAFKEATIIAHASCYERIHDQSTNDLERFKSHKRGTVELVEPNLLFSHDLLYPKDGIKIYHTPGHTRDSSSLYDAHDRTVFVGDNIEHPFPYLNDANFDEYLGSLQSYLDYNPSYVVSGHDPAMNNTRLIRENLTYIESIKELNTDTGKFDERQLNIHTKNLFTIAESYKRQSKQEKYRYYESTFELLKELPETEQVKHMKQKITQELGKTQ
jgi:cyclase